MDRSRKQAGMEIGRGRKQAGEGKARKSIGNRRGK